MNPESRIQNPEFRIRQVLRFAIRNSYFVILLGCGSAPSRGETDGIRRRADEAFLRGDFGQAARLYEQVAASTPADRAWALAQAGKSRNGAAEWDAAVQAFTDALAAGPAPELRLQCLYFRSIAQAARLKFREALDDLAAVEAAPARGQAVREDDLIYRLGVTRMRAGDWAAGRRDLERLPSGSPLAGDASDRLALRAVCIQIARVPGEEDAQEAAGEARSKGIVTEIVKGPRDCLVVTGRFRNAADAQVELSRVRTIYRDAFILP